MDHQSILREIQKKAAHDVNDTREREDKAAIVQNRCMEPWVREQDRERISSAGLVSESAGRHRSRGWNCRVGVAMALVGLVGAVGVGGAGWWLWQIRPKDPSFKVVGIELSGFNLRWMTESLIPYAVVDVSMKISIKVTNPNVTPIKYTDTTMDIFYRGTLLGQAQVEAGSQGARSDQVIEIPAKLDGLKITDHLTELFQDVAKREMVMSAFVTIGGDAIVWKIRHHFEVRVNSDIKVDPVFLKVLDQDNRVEMELAAVPEIESRRAEKGETHAQTVEEGETRTQMLEI